MTIAILLFPSSRDSATSIVATHTVLIFLFLSWIGVKASLGNNLAKWSNQISS